MHERKIEKTLLLYSLPKETCLFNDALQNHWSNGTRLPHRLFDIVAEILQRYTFYRVDLNGEFNKFPDFFYTGI